MTLITTLILVLAPVRAPVLALGLALVLALGGQDPVRAVPADAAVEAGRRALAKGERAQALAHGLAALEQDPRSAAALRLLLEVAAEDPDARTLWSQETLAALGDEQGSLVSNREFAGLLSPKDAAVAPLATARAAAAAELAEFCAAARKGAERSVESVVLHGWAAEVGRELTHAAPALRDRHGPGLSPGFPLTAGARKATLEALERKMNSADASGDFAGAAELALVLRGIAAQSGFKDLEGPAAPDLSKARGAAEAVLARARARLLERAGEPWSVEALEDLDLDQRASFTREHARASNPGLARSPQGWYRIETVCGHGTLLGAAATVEQHHARLARWYGSDPFTARPGLVRLVAESSALESEGAPFFWVGGFQSGDVTTLRMAIGTIEGLGRGLTHELTHRFDGALFPGIPAWLAEGRAVWTGAAYAGIADEEFVANHAAFGTIDDARYKGYGGREKLEQLVDGTIEDYRDNYVAGYALYVYLKTWYEVPGKPLFADRLAGYMGSRAGDRKSLLAAFTAWFCDGEDGRPKDFEGFAAGFSTFVSGFYWRDRKPFTERYVESPGEARGAQWNELLLDEPTWVWSRGRAEPWLGQDQARAAGRLLLGLGDEAGAMAALGWSLAVDERSAAVDEALGGLLAKSGKREGAWVLARAVERRGFAPGAVPAGPAPMLARLPRTRAFLEELRRGAAASAADGRALSAAALAADHDRLATLVGLPVLAPSMAGPDLAAPRLHPFDEPRRGLGAAGWIEDKLAGFDQHRVAGLWCVDERGNLHVGRSTPRVGTGESDRASHVRDAFARSKLWIEPGRWRVRLRVAPTTAFFSAAIVVGYERRDRQARLHLSGGDYAFAIGDKEEPAELDNVGWSLAGLYERDGALPGATRGGTKAFGRTLAAFDVELAVDGGALHAFLDGEYLGTYHTPDGMPLEGFLGFASNTGSYKVSGACLQRLDRSAAYAPLTGVPPPILVDRPRVVAFREAENRKVAGLPLHARGTLCAWLALPELDAQGALDEERARRRLVERVLDFERLAARHRWGTPLVVALPAALGPELCARIEADAASASQAEFEPETRPRWTRILHGPESRAAAQAVDLADARQSLLLFVDSAGVLRAVESLHGGRSIDPSLARWIQVFANR